jgi:hypothetical protein
MTTSLYIAQQLKGTDPKGTQRYASACHEFTMSVNLFGHRDRHGARWRRARRSKECRRRHGRTPARAVFSGNSLLIGTLRAADP